jgi:hypothetical protein
MSFRRTCGGTSDQVELTSEMEGLSVPVGRTHKSGEIGSWEPLRVVPALFPGGI